MKNLLLPSLAQICSAGFSVALIIGSQNINGTTELEEGPKHFFNETLSKAQALEYCRETILSSNIFRACNTSITNAQAERSIEDCGEDVSSSGSRDMAIPLLELMASNCIRETEASREFNESIPAELVNNLCAVRCINNGTCVNAMCVCNVGYGGKYCQYGPNTVPIVNNISWLCDVTVKQCDTVYIAGDLFVDSPKLLCSIEILKVNGQSKFLSVPAKHYNLNMVECHTPRVGNIKIFITNDGSRMSAGSFVRYSFNSSCLDCMLTPSKDNVTCQIKNSRCFIDDECKDTGDLDSKEYCNVCNGSVSSQSWSRRNEPLCQLETKDNKSMIIISCTTAVGLLILTLGTIVFIALKRRFHRSLNLSQPATARFDQNKVIIISINPIQNETA